MENGISSAESSTLRSPDAMQTAIVARSAADRPNTGVDGVAGIAVAGAIGVAVARRSRSGSMARTG